MKRFRPFVFGIVLWLIALMMQSVVFAGGRVEHHQITSKILADAGEVASRVLGVYLPEEYDTLSVRDNFPNVQNYSMKVQINSINGWYSYP